MNFAFYILHFAFPSLLMAFIYLVAGLLIFFAVHIIRAIVLGNRDRARDLSNLKSQISDSPSAPRRLSGDHEHSSETMTEQEVINDLASDF